MKQAPTLAIGLTLLVASPGCWLFKKSTAPPSGAAASDNAAPSSEQDPSFDTEPTPGTPDMRPFFGEPDDKATPPSLLGLTPGMTLAEVDAALADFEVKPVPDDKTLGRCFMPLQHQVDFVEFYFGYENTLQTYDLHFYGRLSVPAFRSHMTAVLSAKLGMEPTMDDDSGTMWGKTIDGQAYTVVLQKQEDGHYSLRLDA